MPKMKSKSGAKKRFSRTGTGKYKYNKKGRRHILTKKTRKRKRKMRAPAYIDSSHEHKITAMVPYL